MTSPNGTKRTVLDWAFEGIAVLAIVGMAAMIIAHWTELPLRVPKHYGVAGRPNGWGGKTGLLVLPLTGLGLFLVLSLAARHPSLMNVPLSIDRNLPQVCRSLQSTAIALKAAILVTFFYIEWVSVRTALGRAAGLGAWFLPASVSAIFLILGLSYRTLRKFSVPDS